MMFAHATISNLDEGAYLLKGLLFAGGEYRPFDPGIWTNKAPLAFLISRICSGNIWSGPAHRPLSGRLLRDHGCGGDVDGSPALKRELAGGRGRMDPGSKSGGDQVLQWWSHPGNHCLHAGMVPGGLHLARTAPPGSLP